jgi:chemotaxis methyl-accepting protein methylase
MGSFQNHHSEFFRDPLVFAFLEERILPNLLFRRRSPAGREIRVWSAGCAAGQEAYSVALLCRELSQRMEDAPPFRIFATDLSETQIALARAGSYSAPDVRNVTQQRLWRWFDRQGEAWVVRPELRALVDFSAHDLLDLRVTSPAASIFGDFDLVLCCNQLMYFRPECTRRVLQKLKRSLAPGGWLVTGDAERVLVQGEGFEPAPLPAAVFTRGDDP